MVCEAERTLARQPLFDSIAYSNSNVLDTKELTLAELDRYEGITRYFATDSPEIYNEPDLLASIKTKIRLLNFESFAEMKSTLAQNYIVTSKDLLLTYEDVTCSCLSFLKEKACKHVFKLLEMKNKSSLVRNTLLPARKRPGRAKVTRSRLRR